MIKKICVALPTSNHLHRQILEGIVNYSRENGPWQLFLVTDDDGGVGLAQARSWGPTGVIAIGRNDTWAREIFSWRVPAVLFNCSLRNRPSRTVYLQRDQERIGKSAAEYFLERHYSSFAFVGASEPADWSDSREAGFVKRLKRAHCRPAIFASRASTSGQRTSCPLQSPGQRASRPLQLSALRRFLQALPNGTALFAAHDKSAQRVLGLCLEMGITVPERLAVLGVDDDRIVCEAMTPPLSSISLDGVNSGHLAAQLIDELMAGRKVDPVLKLDFPRIVTRQSTDTNVISDTIVSKTIARITADLAHPVRLNRIAAELGCSVRTLELKAHRVFGCTLKEKVNRIRLNEAVRLLSNSKLTIAEVAERCGFCGASHLGVHMRAAFGYPPSTFRH